MLEIPYSGSDPLTLSLALDKVISKQIAKQNNITSPDYFVVHRKEDVEKMPLRIKYPVFVKPAWEGSSKGIQQSSKANNYEDLKYYVNYLMDNYQNQPVLVEQYIQGEEFTVAVLGNEKPQILGIMRISPKIKDGTDFFYSIEVKRDWENLVAYECPAKISDSLRSELEKSALAAFKAFGVRDVARVDFRVDKSGVAHFLEINPLPGLSPKYSDIVIMVKKLGWSYDSLITAILNNAVSRYKVDVAYEKI
jgi:D-alanine-D-alanine ligase